MTYYIICLCDKIQGKKIIGRIIMNTYKELIIGSLALIVLIVSIYMSYKTHEIEYAWIIGTSLLAIGSFGKYFSDKKKENGA